MDVKPIVKQEKPATYTSLGTIQVGNGLKITEGGLLSLGWSITATAGEHGSISPSGTVHVEPGTSKTYTFTPDENYIVNDVLVDGISQGVINEYEFDDIRANHTIIVTFKPIIYLFKNGVLSNYFNGFAVSVNANPPSIDNANYTITGNNLILKAYGNINAYDVGLKFNLNLSNYNKIKVNLVSIDNGRSLRIYIYNNNVISQFYPPKVYPNYFGSTVISSKSTVSTGILELDVSNLNDSYDIFVCLDGNYTSTMTLNLITVEQ